MTICRKCGTSNQDSQKFCSFCHELLIADPVELAKMEQAQQKKQQKAEKKLRNRHLMWKYAPFWLIPIALLDFVDLLLCVDLLFLGIGQHVGNVLGELASAELGYTTELFGNLVYTSQFVVFVVRGLEMLGAAALLLLACAMSMVMIVSMVKWYKYKRGSKTESDVTAACDQGAQAAEQAAMAAFDSDAFAVSYQSLEQVAKQCAERAVPPTVAEATCADLFDALRPCLWEYDEDSVRRVLSAMSCSRLLLCSAGAVDRAGVFDSLSRALGTEAQVYDYKHEEGNADSLAQLLLQRDAETDTYTHTAFAKALYAARFAPKNLYLAGIKGMNGAQTESALSPLHPYFKLPDAAMDVYLGRPEAQVLPEGISGGVIKLSPNVWVLSILPEESLVPEVGGALAQYCAVIYLRNSQNVVPFDDVDGEKRALPSVSAWENAVSAAEQEYFLSEELWHVLDLLEEQMQQACGVRFSNRTLRAFERYTAVYLALGGKQQDALDNGLASVLIPAYAKQLRALHEREEGETPISLLDRTVGRDRLPLTVEVLTSMGLV